MCHSGVYSRVYQCQSKGQTLSPQGVVFVEWICHLWGWAGLGVFGRLPPFAVHALSSPRGACPGCNSMRWLWLHIGLTMKMAWSLKGATG
jgi:hypothetical protein